MVGFNGEPARYEEATGFPVYVALCDEPGCGRVCVTCTYDRGGIVAPADWIEDKVGRSPQFCEEHAPPPPPPPPEPVPQTITPAQVRIASMIVLGLPNAQALDEIVEAVISAPETGLSDFEKQAARVKWQHATVIERNHPLIAAVALYRRVGPEIIDDVFRIGAIL